MYLFKYIGTKANHAAGVWLLCTWLMLLALGFQGVHAQGEIAVQGISPEECARFCSGLVNTEGCLHAYYYRAKRLCRLTNDVVPNPNMPGTYNIWSRRHNRWLKASEVRPQPGPGPRGLAKEFLDGSATPCRPPAFDRNRLPRSHFWHFRGPEDVVRTSYTNTYCSLNGARYYLILDQRIRMYKPAGGGHFTPEFDCVITDKGDPNVWKGWMAEPNGPPGRSYGCSFTFRK